MRIRPQHPWNLTPKEAVGLQRKLSKQVVPANDFGEIRFVAGADIALDPNTNTGYAGIIVYSFPELEEVERRSAKGKLRFPYVPGLLSFREGPLLLDVMERLRKEPDLFLFDAQGIAHPRRFGLASHLSVLLDKPGIGVAKSRLCGTHREPANRVGAWSKLHDGNETIGAVLRTRKNVKPIFVSVGHRVTLDMAVELTLACTDGFRIPRPTRQADRWVAQLKKG
jgi:deoxyribonuclease V